MLEISIVVGLAVGAVVVYKYVTGPNKSVKNNRFLARYTLIISLLADKRDAQIEKLSSSSVLLKIRLGEDIHFFNLNEVDERLILVWKLQSQVHGTRGKEWSFSPDYDQSKIYQEVLTDLRNYQASFKTKNPYTDTRLHTAV